MGRSRERQDGDQRQRQSVNKVWKADAVRRKWPHERNPWAGYEIAPEVQGDAKRRSESDETETSRRASHREKQHDQGSGMRVRAAAARRQPIPPQVRRNVVDVDRDRRHPGCDGHGQRWPQCRKDDDRRRQMSQWVERVRHAVRRRHGSGHAVDREQERRSHHDDRRGPGE